MSVAESNPESWAVGFLDECWWSRVALPALNSFSEQTVGLYNLALAMDPLGLYWVEPWALLRQKATDDPHPTAALLHFSVVFAQPSPHLPGDVPACVVPDE